MKGAGQPLKARLIPFRANRGPVFLRQPVSHGGDASPKTHKPSGARHDEEISKKSLTRSNCCVIPGVFSPPFFIDMVEIFFFFFHSCGCV